MTLFTSSTGVVKDLDLDVDKICAYEEQHPDWSLFNVFGKLAECPRFTDFNLLAGFIGYPDYKSFVADGFGVEDLAKIVQESSLLGFTVGEETEG